jgi:aldehyde dehydrogenase (NAD+)
MANMSIASELAKAGVTAGRIGDEPQGELLERLRTTYRSGTTRTYAWRSAQLKQLLRMLEECESEIVEALAQDGGKPVFEAYSGEVSFVRAEARHALRRVRRWMRPKRVRTPVFSQPARSKVMFEPMGVVLIMGAWNYPINEILGPLVGALAAGNCVVLKPSELSPKASQLLARIVPKYLDSDAVRVVEGGVAKTGELLDQRFDKILFTGSTRVGRIVMEAASKHLTPVTLELGGKSPVIVDRSANYDVAARRLTWAKFFHAGQTCLAPDYVLVHRDDHDAFVESIRTNLRDFYGDDPRKSEHYSRMIGTRHLERLIKLLDSGEVAIGGQVDAGDRYLSPTVLRDVSWESPIMQEEIFGPILPVIAYDSVDECITRIRNRPTPLALYLFAEDDAVIDKVLAGTESGGVCVNTLMEHNSNPNLPFGGKGESGMGAYHGHQGFLCFSHQRAVLHKTTRLDSRLAYPPYSERAKALVRFFMG